MTTATMPGLRQLTDTELAETWRAGAVDLPELTAECDRRDRSDRARAAARRRHSEWEAAAYAQYEAAEQRCRGNMLSAAGKRSGRDPWPVLWQGSEETARRLASDELVTFWDYESPRVPGPGAYAAAKRAADRDARDLAEWDAAPVPAPTPAPAPSARPSARELAEAAACAPRPSTQPAGSIARMITALGALSRQADRTTRALERVSGGIPR